MTTDKNYPFSEATNSKGDAICNMHTDRKITEYIGRHYPELAGCDISIGLSGNIYRIMVLDQVHCLHTIKIEKAIIDK